MKSNAELAVELTIAYIQAWFGREKTLSLSPEECANVLEVIKNKLDAISDTKET